MPENLVEGWTEPIDQTLLADGVAIDGTGWTVELQLTDGNDKPVEYSGTSNWLVAADGTARFQPAAGDLLASRSPYRARWKVNALGKIAYFPNAEGDKWTVRK